MGKLSSTFVPTVEVSLPGPEGKEQFLTLRGLSSDDLERIMDKHGPQLEKAYKRFNTPAGLTFPSFGEIVSILRETAPEAIPSIIAIANDDPGSERIAAKLPIGVQINATLEIIKLSFSSISEVKKILREMISGMTGVMEAVSEGITVPLAEREASLKSEEISGQL